MFINSNVKIYISLTSRVVAMRPIFLFTFLTFVRILVVGQERLGVGQVREGQGGQEMFTSFTFVRILVIGQVGQVRLAVGQVGGGQETLGQVRLAVGQVGGGQETLGQVGQVRLAVGQGGQEALGQVRLGVGQVGEGQRGQETFGQVTMGAGHAGEGQGVGHSSGAYAFSTSSNDRLGLLSQLPRVNNTTKINLAIILLASKKLKEK